jgi:hypothetical protein
LSCGNRFSAHPLHETISPVKSPGDDDNGSKDEEESAAAAAEAAAAPSETNKRKKKNTADESRSTDGFRILWSVRRVIGCCYC